MSAINAADLNAILFMVKHILPPLFAFLPPPPSPHPINIHLIATNKSNARRVCSMIPMIIKWTIAKATYYMKMLCYCSIQTSKIGNHDRWTLNYINAIINTSEKEVITSERTFIAMSSKMHRKCDFLITFISSLSLLLNDECGIVFGR